MKTKSQMTPEQVVHNLGLIPLPGEGGFYRETYRQGPSSQTGMTATAIYYLITGSNFSAWHRLPHDEIFHHYSGQSVEIFMISPNGEFSRHILGSNFEKGEVPQIIVPAGYWQGSRLLNSHSMSEWSLLGTTMTPGFEFKNFELGNRNELLGQFPDHADMIRALTREQ